MRILCTLFACLIASFIHINVVYSNAPVLDENGCEISAPIIKDNSLFYPSGNKEGLIGTTKDKPVDNPADNVFHVALDEIPDDCKQIWLEYDLNGVSSHTAVSRSINDQLSAGGYLVQTNEKWTTQRELIRTDWLKRGDNVIRFAVPKGASYSYKVRNLGLRVTEVETEQAPDFIIQNTDGVYYKNQAYLKGIIQAEDEATVSVCIDGEEVVVADGEFEILVNKPETPRKWWFQKPEKKWSVEVEVAYPSGEVKYETVRFDQAEKADFHRNLNKKINYTEKIFSPKTAQQIHLQSAMLNVPADALEKAEIISITALRTVDIPALNPGMVNVTAYHDAYRMLPHGTQFKVPVELTLKYDKSKIPSGYTEADIRTFYFDEITHNWVPVPRDSVDAETGRVFSRTTHFTDYINGIIQVPESPETNAYTPTSIKDIKAANPSAAINEIQPPSANNMGTANLSYPINIPAGRQGMQPSLGIQYNSGGGNGWLGLGWDLSVPAISIETRWGVPRFDGMKETETYSMMGQMLWPVAHRDTPVDRLGMTKQFYPRVEGAFNKIIRHGDKPDNYYWEVTDKSGTTYFYGGVDAVDNAAVLKDAAGNIGHWALVEMRDLNDNFVRYHHMIEEDAGVVGSNVMGQNLYCESITYTGHGDTEGRYSVVFTRDSAEGEDRRKDVQISGRLAFKRVTAHLLDKIEVQLDDVNIRSYELHYKEGEFYKTLLDSITEYDAADAVFVGHKFEYFDEVGNDEGYDALEEEFNDWNTQDDTLKGDFISGFIPGFDDKPSALNGTKSFSFGAGAAITLGVDDGNNAGKSLSLGGDFNFSSSNSEGMVSLVDINGDNLPDKVFKKGGELLYRANMGNNIFGEPLDIIGVSQFYKEKSRTFGGGFQQNGAVAPVTFFAGINIGKTTSVTKVYFTDVNGDQLTDLIINGQVWYNHLTSDGNPVFTQSSADTPSPIDESGSIDATVVMVDEGEQAELLSKHPLHDVVRMWIAPYTGMINIDAPIQLLEDLTDRGKAYDLDDGISATIEKEEEVVVPKIFIDSTSNYVEQPMSAENVMVNEGDRIFFRLGSVRDGDFDKVRWNPVITYVGESVDELDVNGKPKYQFNANDDFKLSGQQTISVPFDGKVTIAGTFSKPITTDDIKLEIYEGVYDTLNKTTVETLLDSMPYGWNIEADSVEVTFETDVLKGNSYRFKVVANTNVDWTAVNWNPTIFYTESFDEEQFPNENIFDDAGEPTINLVCLPEYTIYAEQLADGSPLSVNANQNIQAASNLPGNLAGLSGEITLSIKSEGVLIGKQVIQIDNGSIVSTTPATISGMVEEDVDVYAEYHISDAMLVAAIGEMPTAIVNGASLPAGAYTIISDNMFGTLYRGWGQFAYNSNDGRDEIPIIVDELKMDDGLMALDPVNTNLGSAESKEELEAGYGEDGFDPSNSIFIIMLPSAQEQAWVGYDNLTFVKADTVSSSRMGLDDVSPIVSLAEGANVRYVDRVTENRNTSFSLGGGVVISLSYNESDGESVTITDYQDMNGDRRPDIIGIERIHYTTANGGLEPMSRPHMLEGSTLNISNSGGFNLGGSYAPSTTTTSTISGTVNLFGGGGTSSTAVRPQNVYYQSATAQRTTSSSLGVSGNINVNKAKDYTAYSWTDVNGDGLPDKVYNNDSVALSIGYAFLPLEPWDFDEINKGESSTESAGLGINLQNMSTSIGVGLTRSNNVTRISLRDVNGDGLVDQVIQMDILEDEEVVGSKVMVRINLGNGFTDEAVEWEGLETISNGASTGESANIGFTICFPVLGVKACINPSGNVGQGATKTLTNIMDINGDGYPDYLISEEEDNISVRLSTINRTNLLKSVSRPLGADFEMDYTRVGNTYDMPNSIWTLSSVTINDGFAGDGADTLKNTFEYEDGFYERHEREFYGFKTIKTHQLDTENNDAVYRSNIQTFLNDNYYTKGLMVHDVLQDADGNKFTENINEYTLKNITDGSDLAADYKAPDGVAFPALTSMTNNFYEGQALAGETTGMTLNYDLYGNVTNYTDIGDTDPNDDFTSVITYHEYTDNYIVGIPSSIMVSADGMTYRKRETTIDPATGNILQIRQFLEDDSQALHDMTYDQYGNLGTITRPENQAQERLAFTYEYDPEVHIYTEKVSDSYGYESTATYDYRFGQILENISMNGQPMRYVLDDVGRVTDITGPYEIAEDIPFTIHFDYFPDADMPYALTQHYDPSHPDNFIETSTFIDGLSRPIQVKKDAAIYDADTGEDVERMIVSGRVMFDAFGRTTTAYYPITEALGRKDSINLAFDDIQPTTTTYDVLDRTLTITLPDSAMTTTEYTFGADRLGNQQFMTIVTDANDIRKDNFTDVRGRATSLKEYLTGQGLPDIWTSYAYNPINELVEVTDDQDNQIISEYDWFGRRTSVIHPDAGETSYTYDLASNMTEMVTANLRQTNQAIAYTYEFERLINITYPNFTKNNTTYTYGEFGASDNRAGRIVTQEDASGIQEFFYGPLGEQVKNIRQINVPGKGVFTYTTEWEYDTWNRVKGMRYPDGEVLTYDYNLGGLLHSMSGEKDSTAYNYLTRLGYDEFEQRVYLSYGNGTETTYAYEADRRRLQNLVATTSAGRAMMDNAYEYDAVTNVLSITNSAPIPNNNQKGGPASYTFEYDDLYRLTNAEGMWEGANDDHDYTLDMSYNSIHDITQKTQVHNRKGNEQNKTSYDFAYEYTSAQPHALTRIGGHKTYAYDANGNQTGWDSETSGQRRTIEWDEENRINSIADQGKTYNYTYDAGGIRVLKGQGNGTMEVDVNGANAANGNGIGNYTMYVNPFVVAKGGGYSKHYFIETQRIVSKIGEGRDGVGDDNGNGNGENGNGNGDNGNGNNGNNGNGNGGIGQGDGQGQNNGNGNGVGNGDGNNGNGNNGNNGNGNDNNGNGNGNNGNGNNIEANQYYYHPDHLGNTSYLTDAAGEVYQHIEYTAFGEIFVDEKAQNPGDDPRYLFNGKELDEETGLYYYGARYYDPMESRWLSVDPMAEKYAGWSPYNYTLNNPVNLIDPDGKDVVILRNSSGAKNTGHAAVLIGSQKAGWVYVSKDGFTDSAFGSSPNYVVKHFSSLKEFRNSSHNFLLREGDHHSTQSGNAAQYFHFKLDSKGQKIQRYDKGLLLETSEDTDGVALFQAIHTAIQDYVLTKCDCSDVPTNALDVSKDKQGNNLQNGEFNFPRTFNPFSDLLLKGIEEFPNFKFDVIEKRNNGRRIDDLLKPSSQSIDNIYE